MADFILTRESYLNSIHRLTLLLADSYMSPSTFRAYATRFSMRRSFRAAGSGVGKMACTLYDRQHNPIKNAVSMGSKKEGRKQTKSSEQRQMLTVYGRGGCGGPE